MPPPTEELRVPHPSASFWVMTILATMGGATAADALRAQAGLGSVGAGLVVAGSVGLMLIVQARVRHRVSATYWGGVASAAAAGVLLTSAVTRPDGMPPEATAGILSVVATLVLVGWSRSEGTLSPVAIGTARRERFYWLAILVTSALGSALNTLAVDRLALGSGWSELIFAAFLLAVYAAHAGLLAGAVASFWLGYVIVRPLATTIAWSFAAPAAEGGLGLGAALTTAVVVIAMVLLPTVLRSAKAPAAAFAGASTERSSHGGSARRLR